MKVIISPLRDAMLLSFSRTKWLVAIDVTYFHVETVSGVWFELCFTHFGTLLIFLG